MRRDVLTGDWVSVAAARQNRAFLPPAELDPLAPQTPTNPSEIPSRYDVAVFENKSPSFGPALTEAHGDAPAGIDAPRGIDDLDAPGLGRTRTSVGRCEVVCFSPEHSGSFGTLSPTRARTVIEAWADRTAALSALPGVEQVFPFENRGEAIGVTLPHPHGQIYAYPYITPRTTSLLASIDREGPDLFARILEFERGSERVILEGEHWTAFVPFAARWPLEVHLLPHRHVADFAETSDGGARRARAAVPAAAARRRRALRLPHPLHRRLAPGAGQPRTRHRPPAPAADVAAPRGRQAQVPRRIRGRHGRLDRRRPPRDLGRAPARRGRNDSGGDRMSGTWSAPGRVNLIGEHTDYNDGFVLPFAIQHRTHVALTPRDDGVLRVSSTFDADAVEVPLAELGRDLPRAARRGRRVGAVSARRRMGAAARIGPGRGIRHRRRPGVHVRGARRRRPLVVGGDRGRHGVRAERHLGARTRPRRPGEGRPHAPRTRRSAPPPGSWTRWPRCSAERMPRSSSTAARSRRRWSTSASPPRASSCS